MSRMIPGEYLCLLFFTFVLFLNVKLSMAEASDGPSGYLEMEMRKVSGEEESEAKTSLIIDKFRFLLGIRSFNNRRSHSQHGFLSPASSPSPAPVPHRHVYSHHSPRRSKMNPFSLHHEAQQGDHNTDTHRRRVVIAAAVSSALAFVVFLLGLFLFYWKFQRTRRRRSMMKISVISTDSESRRSKCVSSNSKVSFDLGPEHFCLNSLESASKQDVKVKSSSKQTQVISLLDEKSKSDETLLSVHKTDRDETFSSDDESFHSVCDSYSSDARISNASDRDLSNPTEVLSPLSCVSITSPTHTRIVTPLNQSLMKNTPTLPILNPPDYTNCSSPNDQLTQIMSSPISPPSMPPPPPPPPPPLPANHFPSKLLLRKVSSSLSTRSSGSTSDQQNESSPPCPPLRTPPPPPPSFKVRGDSVHPPPPPPGQPPHFIPVGKDGAPLPKLKPLHWDKVRAASDRSMIWDKMRSSSFEFDEKMIESLFGYNIQTKSDEAKSKTPSPSKHILEPKRLQNITILSKALSATPEQVCNALVQGEGLCLQQLEALVKMVPTKEEETKLSNYQGNINEVDSAERFVMAMLKVPFAFTRIEAMLYRDTFEDEVIHLRKSFAMLEEACKELRSSRLFLKLLEAVLKTGNRMNVGTIRGGARAFKLDALLKLADVKGTDGRTTLLHFVVQEMIRSEGLRESEIITKKINLKPNISHEEKEEEYRRLGLDLVSGLCTELCNVKKTATVDLDVIASSVSNLSDGMSKLRHLVNDDLSMEQNGHFVQSMLSFLKYAEQNIKGLQKDEDGVLLLVREITEYFHGHVSKDEVNPLRIFVIVRDFLGMLDQVCKEVRTLKITHSPNSIIHF